MAGHRCFAQIYPVVLGESRRIGILELLDGEVDRYTILSLTSGLLVQNEPACVGDHANHETNIWSSSGRPGEEVRKGKPLYLMESGLIMETLAGPTT